MEPETRSDQVVQLSSSTMKSLSLAALLVGLIAFDNLRTCQASRQFTDTTSSISEYGKQSEFSGVPVQYPFLSGNALGADSGGSTSYGGSSYGAATREFRGENTGTLDDGEIYGSDADQYGGIKRNPPSRVILLFIRRLPRSQDGGGSGKDREIWGRQRGDYSSGDESISQRRRLGRSLLRILLKKMLLAAARQWSVGEGTEEVQGSDLSTESQWGRGEPGWQSGRRFGESSDSGSTDTFNGRRSQWGQDVLAVVGGLLLVRLGRPKEGDSSDFYGSGNEKGRQNSPYWISSETSNDVERGDPSRSGEVGGRRFSDVTNAGTGYGIFNHMTNLGAGIPFNAVPGSGSGGLTDLGDFEGSSDSAFSQPSTWQGTGSSIAHYQNRFVRSNEGRSYGGISAYLPSADQGHRYYTNLTPGQDLREVPSNYAESGQAGSPGRSYEPTFRGTPVASLDVGSMTGYHGVSAESQGPNPAVSRGFNDVYYGPNSPDVNTARVETQWPQQKS